MLQFVQPWWMWAALGAVVPVLIHLWNIREGKTLLVGSVSLLSQSARRHARSLRLQQLLLLALRCLLIVLLAALLASPQWLQVRKAAGYKGWVLVEKQPAAALYAQYGRQIDSLVRAGFELHSFEPGFPAVIYDSLKKAGNRNGEDTASYWALLRQLEGRAPAALPCYLYTANRLSRFSGNRPAVALDLHWQTAAPPDSVSTWIASSLLLSPDSLRVTVGVSRPAALEYKTEDIALTEAARKGYRLRTGNGKLLVSLGGSVALETDTAPIQVTIFTDNYSADATYLQAALRAVQQYTRRRIQVALTHDAAGAAQQRGWLFWLSGQPLPASKADNVFAYAKGIVRQQQSWLYETGLHSGAEPVAIYKRLQDSGAGSEKAVAVWEDGFGYPVLVKMLRGSITLYSFYSRLDPEWSDLPWSGRFPLWLLGLLLHRQQYPAPLQDNRAIDARQMMPELVKREKQPVAERTAEKTPLDKHFWTAAFIIFLIERLIATRKKATA